MTDFCRVLVLMDDTFTASSQSIILTAINESVEVEGLSALEALQQAVVPIIAEGELTATSQFALDDRSIFPTKDPKALADCIDYWLDHPAEREEMGWRYAASTEEYDIHKSIDALVEMFRCAAATRS